MGMRPEPGRDAADSAHWSAVEEATELLVEERYIEALIELRGVLKKDPTNPYAFHYLGTALYETAQNEPARDAFRAALRLAPNYLGARVGLSHVLRTLGDLDGALREAKEALRRFPNDSDALHAAGLAHAARGNKHLAREHLERYLKGSPELESALEVRQILEMLGIADDDEPVRFE
jgi:tetratricopeptide (TPR) repeat protein